jgi:hypothetical protein
MPYTNCLRLSTIKYLDLLDEVPYKYIKIIIDEYDEDNDEDLYDVEITDLESDIVGYCKTQFKLTLRVNISEGTLPLYVDKTFTSVIQYNGSSGIALTILDLYY